MAEITKQDALAWLDLQRDAVNTEIVYATQDEKKQYHDHLKIINWLAEAARIHGGEMSAVEYLETRKEMCDEYASDPPYCKGCLLDATNPTCQLLENTDPRNAVEIMKQWKEEQDEPR